MQSNDSCRKPQHTPRSVATLSIIHVSSKSPNWLMHQPLQSPKFSESSNSIPISPISHNPLENKTPLQLRSTRLHHGHLKSIPLNRDRRRDVQEHGFFTEYGP